jgi:hypothetical protein
MLQVKIVRTIVGWFNVYNVSTGERVTLSPNEFFAVFNVNRNTTLACCEISGEQAVRIGFSIAA